MTDTDIQALETPIEEAVVAEEPAKEEMLPKSVISKIVERERLKAFEKGKREAMQELQQQNQEQVPQQAPEQMQQQMQQPQRGMGGMPAGPTQEEIAKMIQEQAPQALMHHVNQFKQEQMINSFVSKMQAAEQVHPGLEKKLNSLNYDDPAMHSLVEMANNLENTGDIMKELVDNPNKMLQVLGGIREQPFLAQQSLMSLSNSIKQNQEAKAQEAQAQDPLSSLKPSTNAGMDNGDKSVQDFVKMFRRGRS